MHEIGKLGAAAATSVHINIFGLHPVVRFGSEELKRRTLPRLVARRGPAMLRRHRAERGAQHHEHQDARRAARATGTWSTARRSGPRPRRRRTRSCCSTRTTPRASASRPTDGMTLFYTELDRSRIEVREIEKMGRKAVDSNKIFIDDLRGPRSRTGSARKARASSTSCTASTPSASLIAGRSGRHRHGGAASAPRGTRASA